MEEIWKDIPGYEGRYQVSNLGRVKSLARIAKAPKKMGGFRVVKEFVLKPGKSSRYSRICLYTGDGKSKYFSIHRLVAIAFIPNPKNKPEVNHKDGVRENNNAQNLEWCTSSENQKHAYKEGLQVPVRGSNHGNSFLTEEDVIKIRLLRSEKKMTQQRIANIFGISREHVRDIINKKRWAHI